jgi:hypothetical protein
VSVVTPASYRESLRKARLDWQQADPRQAAARTDAVFLAPADEPAQVSLPFFGKTYRVPHPTGAVVEADSGREVSAGTQILLLHHLVSADGALSSGEWVSFHELPDGRIYQAAFAGRSLAPLSAAFGVDPGGFAAAAGRLDGLPMRLGDSSFWFRVFPRLALAAVLWLGEEDLPGSVNILFDSSAGHMLPTEDLAAVGGMLSGLLLRFRPRETA